MFVFRGSVQAALQSADKVRPKGLEFRVSMDHGHLESAKLIHATDFLDTLEYIVVLPV